MGKEKDHEGKKQEMGSVDEEGKVVAALAIEIPNQKVGQTSPKKGGGWITAPFILGSSLASSIAISGVTIDLLQYLVRRFNIGNIRASQITNIINSVTCLTPVAGAVLCDSYLGCFLTILVFTFISFSGSLMLTLTASLPSLAPPPCNHDQVGSCQPPTPTQFGFLCLAFSVTTLGVAGTTFTYVTMGANQFDRKKDQERFVSYFFLTIAISSIVPSTVIVYIMDNVGWDWGYGLCAALNGIGLALFVPAKWCCRNTRPEGSPFVDLARVVVSAARKIKLRLSEDKENYYHGIGPSSRTSTLTSSFSFINKAALVTEGNTHLDGSIAKRWRLCTVQDVEDLKTLIKLVPLWSTGIYLNIAISIQTNLNILQSLAMDRSLGPRFSIPAASFQVFSYISMTIALPLIDRFFCPFCALLVRRPLTILHKIGFGHVLIIVSLAVMAGVEARRLQVMHQRGLAGDNLNASVVPMSALWLVLPLVINGAGLAFFLPHQVNLYYQEFPAALKNVGTSVCLLSTGIGYFLSTTVVHAMQKATPWLNDDINKGRLDNVYWLLAGIGGINFLYYILCAKFYKLQSSG